MGRDLEGGGVAVVKLGADGKESALLVRKGAARWICLVGGLLVLGSCGAWVMYESRMERQAEVSRLTRLVRSTGERVQALRRVSDRLDDSKESNEVKEKLAKELKLTCHGLVCRRAHALEELLWLHAASPGPVASLPPVPLVICHRGSGIFAHRGNISCGRPHARSDTCRRPHHVQERHSRGAGGAHARAGGDDEEDDA